MFILVIFSMLFTCINLSADEHKIEFIDTLTTINLIPEKDKKVIKVLFKYLFDEQTFAYSLYGDKPMTFCDVSFKNNFLTDLSKTLPLDQFCQAFLEIYCEPSSLIEERWKIWNNYQNQFRISKYILLEKSMGKRTRIFFINKKAFENVVNDNLDLFQKIIDPKITAGELLRQFQLDNTNVFEILHNHEGLLGILLGFGRHNATLFQKREELIDALGKDLREPKLVQEEIKAHDSNLQFLHEYDPYIISSINRVCFVADSTHPETFMLKSKYGKLNKKIREIYSKDDWLEQTFMQLTSY